MAKNSLKSGLEAELKKAKAELEEARAENMALKESCAKLLKLYEEEKEFAELGAEVAQESIEAHRQLLMKDEQIRTFMQTASSVSII